MNYNGALRQGKVTIGMDFDAAETVRRLFGDDIRVPPFDTSFVIPGNPNAIAWTLTDGVRGWHNEFKYGNRDIGNGYNDIISITETNKNAAEIKSRIDEELANPRVRYVFVKMSCKGTTWYKFYGCFKADVDATKASVGTDRPCVIYRWIGDTAECRRAHEPAARITDAEFAALAGREVVMNFLDKIGCTVDGKAHGPVKAWPGMRFTVREIAGDIARLVAAPGAGIGRGRLNEHMTFEIPKTDFQLGYVSVANDGSPDEGAKPESVANNTNNG